MKTRIITISICALIIISCGRRQERLRLESEHKEIERKEYLEKERLRVIQVQQEEKERLEREKRSKIDEQRNKLNEVLQFLNKPFDIQ